MWTVAIAITTLTERPALRSSHASHPSSSRLTVSAARWMAAESVPNNRYGTAYR
jgi:hypothetical protein